jgi:uncharacterized membrane protein
MNRCEQLKEKSEIFKPRRKPKALNQIGLALFAGMFIVSGLSHWFFPELYTRIVPPFLPWRPELVWMSGAFEILGGVGALLPLSRRGAAFGLTILLIAMFPANIYVAIYHVPFRGVLGEAWVQWLRLPLQIPLIIWALCYTKVPTAKL